MNFGMEEFQTSKKFSWILQIPVSFIHIASYSVRFFEATNGDWKKHLVFAMPQSIQGRPGPPTIAYEAVAKMRRNPHELRLSRNLKCIYQLSKSQMLHVRNMSN